MMESERLADTGNDSARGSAEHRQPRSSKSFASYQYPNYPRVDLSIYSSSPQASVRFNSETNEFIRAVQPHHDQSRSNGLDPAEEDESRTFCKASPPPKVMIYFVPGNPGLLEFYDEFFSNLCQSFDHHGGCEVVSSGHLGHSLRYNSNLDRRFLQNWQFWDDSHDGGHVQLGGAHLLDQIDHHCKVVQKLLDQAIHDPSHTRLVIIGHSVGAYIATKILEKYSDRVMHIIGLFPTISHIARSKNGRLLAPLFSSISLPFINLIQIILCAILPKVVVCYLITLLYRPNGSTKSASIEGKSLKNGSSSNRFLTNHQVNNNGIPQETCLVLLNFVLNINSVSAVLKMARSEMQTICELDTTFIRKFHRQLTLVWTSPGADEWVDEREISEILGVFDTITSSATPPLELDTSPREDELLSSFKFSKDEVVETVEHRKDNSKLDPMGRHVPAWKRMQVGVPHAFCLNHNEAVVKECRQLIEKKLGNITL